MAREIESWTSTFREGSMASTCANLFMCSRLWLACAPRQEADIDHFLEEAYRPLGSERAKSRCRRAQGLRSSLRRRG